MTSETQASKYNQVDASLARHGHVSYLEIPAVDAEQSACFYEAIFGWLVQRRDDGRRSFDDRSGSLIGCWDEAHPSAREPGLLAYIYVASIESVVRRIVELGGEIVKPIFPEGNLWVATFRDPAGNVLGIWQMGPRA